MRPNTCLIHILCSVSISGFLLRNVLSSDDLAKTSIHPAEESTKFVLPNLCRACKPRVSLLEEFLSASDSGLRTTVCWSLRLNVRMKFISIF